MVLQGSPAAFFHLSVSCPHMSHVVYARLLTEKINGKTLHYNTGLSAMVYFKENGGEKMTTYKTAEVAAIIGIHPNTVRLYEKLKLIPKPERLSNGYRVFTDFHIWQCRLIRLAFQVEVLQNGLRKKITRMIMVSTLSIGLLVGGIAKNMKSARKRHFSDCRPKTSCFLLLLWEPVY